MKRNLLALAVGAAVLLPLTAQAAPTVYGRLNLSVDYVDSDATGIEPVWHVNSNASRIGLKGNEKLSDDFTAVYKAEWEVDGTLDGFPKADLSGRERYVGLKHSSLGTIRLGGIDSPLKTSEDMVDVFNDNVFLDMGSNGVSGQNRLANSINYVSPKILDVFGANITFVPGESQAENHLGDGISAAFSYEDDNLYLSAAFDSDIGAVDSTRLVGRYKLDKFTVAALVQKAEIHGVNDSDENSFVVSGSYEMDKLTFRGEILSSKHDIGFLPGGASGDEMKTTLVGVGVDYNFTQSTKVYGNLASGKTETDTGGVSTDVSTMLLGGGIEVRF